MTRTLKDLWSTIIQLLCRAIFFGWRPKDPHPPFSRTTWTLKDPWSILNQPGFRVILSWQHPKDSFSPYSRTTWTLEDPWSNFFWTSCRVILSGQCPKDPDSKTIISNSSSCRSINLWRSLIMTGDKHEHCPLDDSTCRIIRKYSDLPYLGDKQWILEEVFSWVMTVRPTKVHAYFYKHQ